MLRHFSSLLGKKYKFILRKFSFLSAQLRQNPTSFKHISKIILPECVDTQIDILFVWLGSQAVNVRYKKKAATTKVWLT